jgi:hypothetical protein
MKKCFTSCLAIVLLGSCVPEFKYPLPEASKLKVDKEVLGTWYAIAESGKISKVTISGKKTGWIEIRYVDNIRDEANEPYYVPMPTYTSEIAGEKFLSIPLYALAPNGKVTDSNGYTIVNYKVQQSTLSVRLFLLYKVQHLVETGVLKGNVEKGFPFGSVIVTSSGKDVANAIKENGLSAFTDPNVMLVLTRERPDMNSSPKAVK